MPAPQTLPELRQALHTLIDQTQDEQTLRYLHQLVATAKAQLPQDPAEVKLPEPAPEAPAADAEEAVEQWRRFLSCNC